MQLVPLLAWSGNGATQDMAKEFEWMLREFLLANLRGARRVGKSRISNLHARGQNVGRTEYIFVPQGAFYHARVCSDADCSTRSSTCWSGCRLSIVGQMRIRTGQHQ